MDPSPVIPNTVPFLHLAQEDDDNCQQTGGEILCLREDAETRTAIDYDVETENHDSGEPESNSMVDCSLGCSSLKVKLKEAHFLTRTGVYYALISAIFFSVQGAFNAAMASTMSPYQVPAMAVPVALVGSFTILIWKRIPLPKEVKMYLWLVPSGITLSCLFCFFVFSYKYIPLAETVTVSSLSLLFVSVLSWIILREPFRLMNILFAFIALVGVTFIARPSFIFGSNVDEFRNENPLPGILFALGAAITSAATSVFVRKQSTLGIHSLVTSFSNCIHVELITIILCTSTSQWQLPTRKEWLLSLGNGCSYFIAQISMYLSLNSESPTLVVIVSTLQIVLAFVWQIIFFHIPPHVTSYIGGGLILFACIGVVLRKGQNHVGGDNK